MNDLLETAGPAHGDVPSRKRERLESFLSGLAQVNWQLSDNFCMNLTNPARAKIEAAATCGITSARTC